MNYFVYAPELDLPAYARWARAQGLPWIEWTFLGPAMLRDVDLVFSSFDPSAKGGLPTLRTAIGKRVAGAIYELPDDAAPSLDRFANVFGGQTLPSWSQTRRVRKSGIAQLRTSSNDVEVATYVDRDDVGDHAPPTSDYLQSLVAFSARLGHSHGWIMHLMSMQTADGLIEPLMYDI